jgi:hypothetical protein
MQFTTSGANHSMSAWGQKRTFRKVRAMSALPRPPKADIETGPVSASTQQLRQLSDIRCDPSCLIRREQLGRRSPAGLLVERKAA